MKVLGVCSIYCTPMFYLTAALVILTCMAYLVQIKIGIISTGLVKFMYADQPGCVCLIHEVRLIALVG